MYQFLLKLIIDKFKRVNVSDGPTYLPTDEWRDVANYFFKSNDPYSNPFSVKYSHTGKVGDGEETSSAMIAGCC